MTKDDVKFRIIKFLNETLDVYIPQTCLVEKLKNATMKLLVEKNIGIIEHFISTFTDTEGNIDVKYLTDYYENILFENGEFKVDVRDLIPDNYHFIKQILPDKMILFKKNELTEIFTEKD